MFYFSNNRITKSQKKYKPIDFTAQFFNKTIDLYILFTNSDITLIHLALEAWVFPRMTRRHDQWVVQDLDGYKNLHYVASTRAEKLCYLVNMSIRVNSQFKETSAQKSGFLCIQRLNKHIVDLGVI